MYLKNALILQSGPLQDLELDFEFNDDGTPKPTVVVGKNGTGKSNLLSFVTDAIIEIAAKKFVDVAPPKRGGGHMYYRIVGGASMRIGSDYELTLLKFEENANSYTYISKAGKIEKSAIQHRLSKFPQTPNWPLEEWHKSVVGADAPIEDIFRKGCYVSFPSGRSERPYWSTDREFSESAVFRDNYRDELGNPIVVQKSLQDIKPWLVDVILDQMVDIVRLRHSNEEQLEGLLASAVANTTMLTNLNSLLSKLLQVPQARLARAGRQSGSRKLIVLDGSQAIILPGIDSFSSGQAMLMGIFSTILRYADTGTKVAPTVDMRGIVVVDEIDAHLHADLMHDVLPQLMRLFPKIQFIVTAHSPLFPLGMEKEFGADGFSLVELPSGNRITTERFSEFQSAFHHFSSTRQFDYTVRDHYAKLQRPLVLGEGQTDPKYLKTAAELLGFSELARNVDFDWVGRFENGQSKGGGADKLRQAYKMIQNIPTILKVQAVFLFDCEQKDQREFDEGSLHVRVLRQNKANSCDSGIENLLPSGVFEEDFFEEKTRRKGADKTTHIALKKVELCNHLCDVTRKPEDFEGFRDTLQMLQGILFPDEANATKAVDNPEQSR